ncbi:MAG: hypothetical protein JNK85_05120 [Verrucomicrobiales bacterium]|nr:hypothetical protein [Verrucomicrobiales bacterium]
MTGLPPFVSRFLAACITIGVTLSLAPPATAGSVERRLYVAAPGIRNYLEFGGHGILIYDIDHNYRFLRRIAGAGMNADGDAANVKGIAANSTTQRLYVTTLQKLACYDLITDNLLWEKEFEGGCDRLAITPDGRQLFVPSLEKTHWNIVAGDDGRILKRLDGFKSAHNTIVALDGRHAYLADRSSPLLAVVDVDRQEVTRQIGPFSQSIRPFTINAAGTRVYVCVDELLGFEIGDLTTGKLLQRVSVEGFNKGPVKRHSCPSHGVGLTPDEREVWVVDAANQQVHVFDNTLDRPRQLASIPVREQPGWIAFSLDGRHAWPSTGEVIDVASKRVVTALADRRGTEVHSEKLIEVQFDGKRVVRVGDQFGLGRAR